MAERRRGLAAAALAALLWPGQARADKDFVTTDDYGLLPGTTRFEAARQAALTNAQIFGAVGAYTRHISPFLSSGKDGALFEVEYHATFDVMRAPGSCKVKLGKNLDGCNLGTAINPVDLYGSNFAIGYRKGGWAFFYTASFTMPVVIGSPLDRGITSYITIMGPVLGHGMVPIQLISKKLVREAFPGASLDAIIGGSYGNEYVSVAGGYALSQGLFGDVQVPKISAFATALLGDRFTELSTLLAGFRQFDYLAPASVTDTTGKTSLFARQLRYVPPQNLTPDQSALDAGRDGSFNFLSGHIEQTDIARYIDVSAAYLLKPKPLLHEASVSIHTPKFRSFQVSKEPSQVDGPLHAALSVGVVTMPDLLDFGVEGGRFFKITAEVASGPFFATIGRNDARTLAMFPMAYNAFDVWFGLRLIARD